VPSILVHQIYNGCSFKALMRGMIRESEARLTLKRAKDVDTPSNLIKSPFPSLTSSEGPILGSSSSLPKMGFSPTYLRVLARSIYGTVFPTGLRPYLPRRSPFVVLPLLNSALSHEYTTISNPLCASSSTLDRACIPRRDINETGEISEG